MEAPPSLEGASALYVVVSPTARTVPEWPLRGYAGPSGRLDVVARALAAALLAEPSAAAAGVLLGPPRPPVTVILDSTCVDPPSWERGVMAVLRSLLAGGRRGSCTAVGEGLEWLAGTAKRLGFRVYLLEEGGVDVGAVAEALRGRAAFIAGSHVDIPDNLVRGLRGIVEARLSVGPRSLLTSQVFSYLGVARSKALGGRLDGERREHQRAG